MKFSLMAPVALLFLAVAARAQPTAFTYQGCLTDGANPATGLYDFQFQIYSGSVVVAGPRTNAPVGVTNGLFTVALDFGAAVFDGSSHALEIAVRSYGDTNAYAVLSPRQPITSAPYAIQAINAGTAANLSGTLVATSLTGTLPDALLSTNVALLNAGAAFAGSVTATRFNGSGAGLASLPATNLIGTIPDARLSANIPLLNGSANFNGSLVATQFVGNGYGLTNVPGAFFWVTLAGNSVTAFPNCGYLATNDVVPLRVTLPTTPRVGDIYRVSGVGGAGWVVAQNANQVILAGNLSDVIGWNWTARASTQNWYSVASSADGTKLVAVANGGHPYTSTDSGATWIQRDTSYTRNWTSVASSANGANLVATVANSFIYTSINYGANWTPQPSGTPNWKCVASSADGTKLVAVAYNGQIYTSANSGVGTWTARATSQYWNSVASSADGTRLVAVVNNGHPYTSTDSGVTWVQQDNNNRYWTSVASSADGNRLVATPAGGQIFFSNDAGTNWVMMSSFLDSLQWTSITSSADGSRLAVVNSPGNIYDSTDSGLLWVQCALLPSLYWTSIASSADGSKLVAVANGGQIYTSSHGTTTPGALGYLSGTQQTAIELQYVGNGQFLPLSHIGAIVAH